MLDAIPLAAAAAIYLNAGLLHWRLMSQITTDPENPEEWDAYVFRAAVFRREWRALAMVGSFILLWPVWLLIGRVVTMVSRMREVRHA